MKQKEIRCPRCKGRGADPIYVDYPMGCQACHACDGKKKILTGTLNYKIEVVDAGFGTPEEVEEYK